MSIRKEFYSEYITWKTLRQRCLNPTSKDYKKYGGRGIGLCDRWNSFEDFLFDMGAKPSKNHSIDRINNDGWYEPENCRWADNIEQNNNRSISVKYSLFGITLSSPEWSRVFEIPVGRIWERVSKNGWSEEKALTYSRFNNEKHNQLTFRT